MDVEKKKETSTQSPSFLEKIALDALLVNFSPLISQRGLLVHRMHSNTRGSGSFNEATAAKPWLVTYFSRQRPQ